LSVYHDQYHFHLLGYNYDHRDSALQEGLKTLQESRDRRNSAILEKLGGIGIGISAEELQSVSGGGQTGRPHIARILVAKKFVKTIDQAFAHYLKKGACAYVSRYILTVEEAISLIHGAGGIAVLAHPAQISYSIDTLDRLLRILVDMGLDGVETYYPTQKGSFLKKLKRVSSGYGLLETGGSDYHGDIRPNTDIAGTGRFTIPVTVLDEILERLDNSAKK
jgi:predicted metal-dependent phosphoesterase TrpH